MDSNLYKRLVDCSAESCWTHVRDVIAVQLMGSDAFPVPELTDAVNYDVGSVILKSRRSKLEKCTGVKATALPVGQLSTFVQDDQYNELMQRLGKRRQESGSSLNQAYEFIESDMKHGVKKTVQVQLWGCEKWALDYLPQTDELAVDIAKKGYTNLDRLFLITEVFYVNEARISLTIGDKYDEFNIKGRMPIGFSLMRFELRPDGRLGAKTPVKPGKWNPRWIKCQVRDKDDALPLINPGPSSIL